jgi:hypothetical protein
MTENSEWWNEEQYYIELIDIELAKLEDEKDSRIALQAKLANANKALREQKKYLTST